MSKRTIKDHSKVWYKEASAGETSVGYGAGPVSKTQLLAVEKNELSVKLFALLSAPRGKCPTCHRTHKRDYNGMEKIFDAISETKDDLLYEYNQLMLADFWGCDPP